MKTNRVRLGRDCRIINNDGDVRVSIRDRKSPIEIGVGVGINRRHVSTSGVNIQLVDKGRTRKELTDLQCILSSIDSCLSCNK